MEPETLLRALADGEPHSGEDLARQFGVTRAAVWKHRAELAEWGLEIVAIPGVGYRLARSLDLLEPTALRRLLPRRVAQRLGELAVVTEIDSTNAYLLERRPPAPGVLDACLAEYQRAGRGRRGRAWRVPLGAGLCFSVSWRFAETPPDLGALTLAIGVVVRRALERVVGLRIGLKWPNDLVIDGRKLGGILLELAAEAQSGCRVVAGIGINVAVPETELATLCDWPRGAIDLKTAIGGPPPPRIALAAALLEDLTDLLVGYAADGFRPYRSDWRAADDLRGRQVTLHESGGTVIGTALGIEADGALLIELTSGARRRVISGDVSVRATP